MQLELKDIQERGRPHLPARDARPGGGHDHGRHRRRHEQGRDRADGRARGALRAADAPRSSPTSSASRTCSPGRGHRHRRATSIVVDIAGTQGRGAARARPAPRRARSPIGVRPEKLALHTEAPTAAAGRQRARPGPRHRRLVQRREHPVPASAFPGSAASIVFAQNMAFGPVVNDGRRGLGHLEGRARLRPRRRPGSARRVRPPTTTPAIAMQRRERLEAELEEA